MVRQFGVFVDDVGVPDDQPTLRLGADRLTRLQQLIDQKWNFKKAHPADTVKPLHFVPQLYAYSWVDEAKAKTFFESLAGTPSKVNIYITGCAIWTVPNSDDPAKVSGWLGREVAWWWNYPCNDNDMDKLFMLDTLTALRRRTRIGMGTCQGELCSCRAAGLLSKARDCSEQAKAELASFLNERWKGMYPIAWLLR